MLDVAGGLELERRVLHVEVLRQARLEGAQDAGGPPIAHGGVVDVHDIHVWQLTRGAPVFSAHVVVDGTAMADGRASGILSQLQSCLSQHFDVEHSTFQLEPAGHVEHDAHA